MHQVCTRSASGKLFTRCAPSVHQVFIFGCARCDHCSPGVHQVCTRCALGCAPGVHHVFSGTLPNCHFFRFNLSLHLVWIKFVLRESRSNRQTQFRPIDQLLTFTCCCISFLTFFSICVRHYICNFIHLL